MLHSPFFMRGRAFTLSLGIALSLMLSGCSNSGGNSSATRNGGGENGTLTVAPEVYAQMVSLFYAGALAYQTTADAQVQGFANKTIVYMEKATQLVPDEPAAWANLALARLKLQTRPEEAQELMKRALSIAPASGPGRSALEALYGEMEVSQGHSAEAIPHFRSAIQADPNNVRARYALAKALLIQPTPQREQEIVDNVEAALQAQPDNGIVLLLRVQLAAEKKDTETLKRLVARLGEWAPLWPEKPRVMFAELEKASLGPDVSQSVTKAKFLSNLLGPTGVFKTGQARLRLDVPLQKFVRLPNPNPTPAAPDAGLTFTERPLAIPGTEKWTQFRTLTLTPELPQDVAEGGYKQENPNIKPAEEGPVYALVANGKRWVTRPMNAEVAPSAMAFPGGSAATPPNPEGIVPLDFNYDFLPDVACTGTGGLRLYQQRANVGFQDVTATSRLPASVTKASLWGAWAADYEADGDLDLVIAPVQGAPFVARNNGDGSWKVLTPFTGVTNARAFAWADLNARGEPDAAFADAQGRLHLFENLRAGQFRPWAAPPGGGKVTALSVTDPDRDGVLDIALLEADGTVRRLSRNAENTGWDSAELTKWTSAPNDGTARLLWADLDNNGGLDLIATSKSQSAVWLSEVTGGLKLLSTPVGANSLQVSSTSENGMLSLLGVSVSGTPVQLLCQGTKNYHWQDIRPRATFVVKGDGRINSFGIGGELELRAGLLYAKQPLTGSTLHYGLGENKETSAIHIIWPNGYPRSDFPEERNGQMKADIAFVARYYPGGSCPWLYAWNGEKMAFVTDCIWRSPLGMRVNAQDTAGIAQTEDWVKIRGDQLKPRDGFYDLSLCAELWETHFFDHLSLLVVDHPVGTDVFVDERFAVPPPPLAVIVTSPPKSVVRAIDDNGDDVTEIVATRDGKHLDTFGRGQYQGVTRDHYVEVEIGEDTPRDKPLYLIANGWIHPTDSSLNVAMSQGSHEPPKGLSLEIPDGSGGWRVAKPGLGFPEGKVKTVVLDLTGLFQPGQPRRARLRTNLEIFWDFLGYATGLPDTPLKKQRLDPATAELRYRGFSATIQGDTSTTVTGDYDHIAGVEPSWLDLEGYYTRFGDVRPLLTKTDDRYVIMNAGDEMLLRFPELPPPPDGWTRDYVLIGDGWVKDGNFNTAFSRTVLPLPYHGQKEYNIPPRELEHDPVYRRHPRDWEEYHTRYVSPHPFLNAMKPPRD
jgi:Tfp pilus assembly protein PilF